MSGDQRPVNTDALATLGHVPIPEDAGRDAIHVAVEPTVAGELLKAGDRVTILNGLATKSTKPLGIVDPFIERDIQRGEPFWMLLFPRTITSLRHVWSHPLFQDEKPFHEEVGEGCLASDHGVSALEVSKAWMQEWANVHMSYDDWDYVAKKNIRLSPERALANAIDAGHDLSVYSYEDARDYIDDRWWDHWEMITGEKGQRGEYFSCGC